jgi:hypothetical protein
VCSALLHDSVRRRRIFMLLFRLELRKSGMVRKRSRRAEARLARRRAEAKASCVRVITTRTDQFSINFLNRGSERKIGKSWGL